MAENTGRVASIYLEDWQMRLIKDVGGEVCHIWDVPVEEKRIEHPAYGAHEPVDSNF